MDNDYDSIVKLIEANHGETIRSLDRIEKTFSNSIIELNGKVDSHDRSITKIKTIGTIAGTLWAGVVLIFSIIFK